LIGELFEEHDTISLAGAGSLFYSIKTEIEIQINAFVVRPTLR
jgi:hypothetical protein